MCNFIYLVLIGMSDFYVILCPGFIVVDDLVWVSDIDVLIVIICCFYCSEVVEVVEIVKF